MRRRRRLGMTLVEVVVSSVVLTTLILVAVGAVSSAAGSASASNAVTEAQTSAERALRLIREHLAMAASASTPSAPGLVVIDPVTTDQRIEVEFTPIDRARPLFDPANPGALPWSGSRRVIKFEPESPELLDNGVDDDRDLLVDEGRIVLCRRASGVDTPIVVLATGVRSLVVSHDPLASPLARVFVQVTVERVIPGAIRDAKDLAGARVPRTRHTAHALVPLLN
jgi:type II secretory pathway pseudopilin PulG